MRIPTIGLTIYGDPKTHNVYLPRAYVDSVRKAGGLPILLAPGESNIKKVLSIVDGLIFAGGGDISPKFYRGSSHGEISRVDEERDQFEYNLAKASLDGEKPVLGICRGIQLLNVVTGGNLIPHIPDLAGHLIEHRAGNGDFVEHTVQVTAGSRLAQITGPAEMKVQSKHHQALDQIPEVWQAVAHAPDGLVEAIVHRTHPWTVGVLWHPEESLDDPSQCALLDAFVAEAANRMNVATRQT